jgi:16S rRNA (guanine527-N7)-methyltransferase
MKRRAASPRAAIGQLRLGDRIQVAEGRAEALARDPARREQFALVTARSFAGPAATAEIATGLVEVGGILVVSEPPEPLVERWPPASLSALGFAPAVRVGEASGTFAVIRKISPAPLERPRDIGKPGKRPLW